MIYIVIPHTVNNTQHAKEECEDSGILRWIMIIIMIIQYNTTQYGIACKCYYYDAIYNTIQYSTVQYSTVNNRDKHASTAIFMQIERIIYHVSTQQN